MSHGSKNFEFKIPDGMPAIQSRGIVTIAVVIGVLAFVVAMALTGYTYLAPGKVAVIKNNLTGAETVQQQSGLIIHLPLGLTDVYILDRRMQVFTMGEGQRAGDRSSNRGYRKSKRSNLRSDNVKIKAADGSNVEVDVEVNFKVIPAKAADIIHKVGIGDAFKHKMIRSYCRALIREKYGNLKLEEISDPSTRTVKNLEVQKDLNNNLEDFGVEVTLVNSTNFAFNPEYERLVKEKKATAQEYTNQKAAQEKAQKVQEAEVAKVSREKNNAVITARGEARKRIVEADAKAKQLIHRAGGEAYSKNKEGDRSFEVARNEAQAVEAEGLNTAAGIKKLTEAYARGGIALVKEALAKKMVGSKIHGRPYSLSESIERLSVEKAAVGAGTRASEKGGSR